MTAPSLLQDIPLDRVRSLARLRLGNVRSYLADLEAYKAGDVGRFDRMVDGRGEQLGLYDRWVEYVEVNLADDELHRFCDRSDMTAAIYRARTLGLDVKPLGGDDVEG